ncbi:MAG: hypothetical protein ACTSRU_18120 [Candidatus Hodarchaeales archaeon]
MNPSQILMIIRESIGRDNKKIAATIILTYVTGSIIYALTALLILHGQRITIDAYSALYWPVLYFESFVKQLMTFTPGIILPSLAAMMHISTSAIISHELVELIFNDVEKKIDMDGSPVESSPIKE